LAVSLFTTNAQTQRPIMRTARSWCRHIPRILSGVIAIYVEFSLAQGWHTGWAVACDKYYGTDTIYHYLVVHKMHDDKIVCVLHITPTQRTKRRLRKEGRTWKSEGCELSVDCIDCTITSLWGTRLSLAKARKIQKQE
jgi:hypothetical protein